MRFARSNNAAKRQPERATPWHRMLKDVKDDDDEDSNEAAASSTPSDLAPKRKSVEPDEEEAKAKVSKVEGATDVTTKAAPNAAAKKDVEDVSEDDDGEDGSEDGEDEDPEGADEDEAEGAGDSEEDDEEEEEEEEEEDAKPAKKTSAKGNSKGTDKRVVKGDTVCFKCRQTGHLMKECPNMKPDEDSNLCYKCGSAEHFSYNCKIRSKESMPFAHCFICNKKGHIARSCPQKGKNPKGGKGQTMAKNKTKQKVVSAARFASNKSADSDENIFESNNSKLESRPPSSKNNKKTVKF